MLCLCIVFVCLMYFGKCFVEYVGVNASGIANIIVVFFCSKFLNLYCIRFLLLLKYDIWMFIGSVFLSVMGWW